MTERTTAAEFWERRYAGAGAIWSGRVNRALSDVAETLTPGTALDLGCGEGGDAVWLARHGWTVTGLDLSATAVGRAREAAAAAGLAGSARFEIADLAAWDAPEEYDLVTASFLQSWPVTIPRAEILRRAAGFVAPGGRLLVVAHAAAPSWADPEHVGAHPFPTPREDLDALSLAPERWTVLACETRAREAVAPDGAPAALVDGVVLALRIR
ncbi:class I SAM-dependent methyltransferase [Microbacterium tumbae]